MITFFASYHHLLDQIIVNSLLALSQYIVLRAGVFSVATAGIAAIGAYTAAICATRYGIHPVLGVAAGTVLATSVSMLLALPLSMLRGVYQAIATLAFVQIVLSVNLNAESLTNGPFGINSIPNVATTPILIATLAVVMVLLTYLNRSGIGRAFDAIRQDETVAVCLGISVFKFHFIAFAIAGALAGLGGALEAYNSFSIAPNSFGFSLLVGCLAFVVLGGRTSLWGPVVGAALLTMLPEIFRPLADYRMLAHGMLLVMVMAYLENGIVDTLIFRFRSRKLARSMRDNVQPAPEASL